ncbi:hypothetical protein QZH41_002087 [Actinostola sp. cb2023]|nr:hypothetical protein QZH41_002087 [Actinostola sp. cb2023]
MSLYTSEEDQMFWYIEDTPVVDTINGFASVGADVEDGNYKAIEPLIHKNPGPQASNPYDRHPESPLPGITSQRQPWETNNKDMEQNYLDNYPNNKEFAPKATMNVEATKNKEWRDAIALKSFYTSETQSCSPNKMSGQIPGYT